MPASAAERLRQEFPWLTDEDIKVAQEKARAQREAGGTKQPHAGMCLDAADYEDDAFDEVMTALEERREEWRFEDDDVGVNFYTFVAGGAWTQKFKGVVADSVSAKCRAHVRKFCDRFHWPKMKVFHFSAHGELGSTMLAREWCRKGHHYFEAWLDSGGLETFARPEDHPFVDSEEFLDLAVGVDTECQTWGKLMELRQCVPKR